MSDSLRFRKAIFSLPFSTALVAFLLRRIIFAKRFSEALFAAASIFPLVSFTGLVYEAM
jgi:hypothetical protein